jgi:LytS/YehU family sensor histidine kinase
MIPPLLFIPFIENSFKHSRIIDTENGWVKIKLSSTEKMIHFEISNSIPAVPIAKDKTRGIGLENVRRRLELLYPGSYELNISETKSAFNVELNIFNES